MAPPCRIRCIAMLQRQFRGQPRPTRAQHCPPRHFRRHRKADPTLDLGRNTRGHHCGDIGGFMRRLEPAHRHRLRHMLDQRSAAQHVHHNTIFAELMCPAAGRHNIIRVMDDMQHPR
jgi:hypothetical protein